jgi:phosphate transport system permease protein
MAVTMLIGNRADISTSFFSPAATMSSVIANEYADASSNLHISSLTAVGFALLLVSIAIYTISNFVIHGLTRKNYENK